MAKLFLGADHAGYELKESVKSFLDDKGVDYEDLTPEKVEGDDYPDQARKVAERVSKGEGEGLLFCGTGMGVSIAANKVDGVRAARVATREDAELAKRHNNANVITMGGRTADPETAKEAVEAWLEASFEGGRHKDRVDKIKDME